MLGTRASDLDEWGLIHFSEGLMDRGPTTCGNRRATYGVCGAAGRSCTYGCTTPNPLIAKIDPAQLCDSAYCFFYLALAHTMRGELERAAELAREAHAQLQRRHRVSHVPGSLRALRALAAELGLSRETCAACGL